MDGKTSSSSRKDISLYIPNFYMKIIVESIILKLNIFLYISYYYLQKQVSPSLSYPTPTIWPLLLLLAPILPH